MTDPQVAEWRRKYGFAWYGEFVAEGFDETFGAYAPGNLSLLFAEQVMKIELSRNLKCAPNVIHKKQIVRN